MWPLACWSPHLIISWAGCLIGKPLLNSDSPLSHTAPAWSALSCSRLLTSATSRVRAFNLWRPFSGFVPSAIVKLNGKTMRWRFLLIDSSFETFFINDCCPMVLYSGDYFKLQMSSFLCTHQIYCLLQLMKPCTLNPMTSVLSLLILDAQQLSEESWWFQTASTYTC